MGMHKAWLIFMVDIQGESEKSITFWVIFNKNKFCILEK